MTTHFSLANRELRISRDDATFIWQGQVDSLPVAEMCPLPDGNGALLLLEPPSGFAQVPNLVKIDIEGNVIWRGQLPADTHGDCFTSLAIDSDGNVTAATWSGYRVLLSGQTGRLIEQRFAK